MNKVISIASAVMLGVVVMALPLVLILPVYQQTQTKVGPNKRGELLIDVKEEGEVTETYGETEVMGREMGGIILSNMAYAGSIVTFGVLVALGVFIYARKKFLSSA
ncbi:MAG: hypothetical protein ACE5NN_08005 [Candidatus Bathyarchaeia archaeon]